VADRRSFPSGPVAAALIGVGTLTACSGPASTAAPPPPVVVLVPGPPSAYRSVTVVRGGIGVPVPAALRPDVAPLVVARVFSAGATLAAFGLDRPSADLHYRRPDGSSVDVDLGGPTFDHHFVYARRTGQADVALVAASVADPLLALVGVSVPPPT
jgi:hypothetical protein